MNECEISYKGYCQLYAKPSQFAGLHGDQHGIKQNFIINIQEIRVISELQERISRQSVTVTANLSFESL